MKGRKSPGLWCFHGDDFIDSFGAPGANLMPRFQFGKPAGAKDQDVTNRQVFYETTMSAGLDEKKLMRPQNKTWAPQLP